MLASACSYTDWISRYRDVNVQLGMDISYYENVSSFWIEMKSLLYEHEVMNE